MEPPYANPRNNFQTWMESLGFSSRPGVLAMFNAAGELKRHVHWCQYNLGSVVQSFIAGNNKPLHLGPVTQCSQQKVYLYLLVGDWSLRYRIQADLLCYIVLMKLSQDRALQVPGRTLRVCWCTHKYKMGATGESLQSAKGSGGRTHFYLVSIKDTGAATEPEAEPAALQGVQVANCYHTTMWFSGTYPSSNFHCVSTRLLLSWSAQLPEGMAQRALTIWSEIPSEIR